MKAYLVFVPRGGGEADYSHEIEIPAPPHPGDYITVIEKTGDKVEGRHWRVRRCWWDFEMTYPGVNDGFTPAVMTGFTLRVECEAALGPYSSESHREAYSGYLSGSGEDIEFDSSMY